MKMIYELIYAIEQQNGNLVFSKEVGIKKSELSEIQTKMLNTNYIPRLVPLEIEERDFNIKLRYNIAARQSLKGFLETNNVTLKQYYQILYNIVAVIDDSKIYMLNEQNYLLSSDLIFVGQDMYDIYLIYLPLSKIPDKAMVEADLKELALELSTQVKPAIGAQNNELLKYVEQEFTIQSLKKKLLTLMNFSNRKKSTAVYPAAYHSTITDKAIDISKKQESKIKDLKIKESKIKKQKIGEPLRPLTDREKTVLYSLTLLIIALIWKFYSESQSEGEGLLYICFGLTFLLIDIDLILTKLWRPGFRNRGKPTPKSTEQKQSIAPIIDETVLLTEKLSATTVSSSYLEKVTGNRVEQIIIGKDSFIIGRNISTVDYVEDAKGVSRIHLEVKRDGTGYYIKDLFSKNGSFLNHEELKPNLQYPVKDGDVISIGKSEFIFRMGVVD